jgi:hypothetical protein
MGSSSTRSLVGRIHRSVKACWARAECTSPPSETQPSGTAHTKFVICDYTIEESFRDDKSGSFDLGATKLRDAERLNHLLLAVAVATLWIYEIGEQVLRKGERSEIDPGYKRQLSVFQIGRRKLQRAFNCGKTLLFNLRLHPFRLAPVSKKC